MYRQGFQYCTQHCSRKIPQENSNSPPTDSISVNFNTSTNEHLYERIFGLYAWHSEAIKVEYPDPRLKGYERGVIGKYQF